MSSPTNSERDSPRVGGVDSPPAQMGGAWGGSEYLGGGLIEDTWATAKAIKNVDFSLPFLIARGIVSALTLLFVLLLIFHAVGKMNLGSTGAETLGAVTIISVVVGFGIDLMVISDPNKLTGATPLMDANNKNEQLQRELAEAKAKVQAQGLPSTQAQ
jgi:hypothetical protein